MSTTSPNDPYLDRLQHVYVAVVSDALDALGLRHQIMAPRVRPLYAEARIVGRAHPIHFRPAERIPSQEEYHFMEIEAMDSLLPGEVYLGRAWRCAAVRAVGRALFHLRPGPGRHRRGD